ncbi:ADYC domain-containing protein [Nannocystis sp. bb15-2]|uniref:ADYC domain-containing protein n=2 Tax=Nannocystis bainbridge TaxID=2995303 RepID=A0ABT5E0L2_9BACT|nr:ADYC domain-containing protein [Nannocystis bainbridge]
MSKRWTWLTGVAASMAMGAGCDAPEAGECGCSEDVVSVRESQLNGAKLNGAKLNGARLNGARLNGARLNGPNGTTDYIEIEKIRLRKESYNVQSSWLVGSNLHIKTTTNEVFSGTELDSTRIKFDLAEGGWARKKTLKVLDVEPLAPGSDVLLYDLALKVDEKEWEPLCVDEEGEPTQAILLGDVWDSANGKRLPSTGDGLTFACRDAALAKCVEWGYRPWKANLREFHQACTRLVRADYCGNGSSHTEAGTLIHVLDQIGVQTVDPDRQFVVEAEWGPNGAVCLNTANTRLANQQIGCNIPACGAPFASGGLIQSGKIVVGP